MKTKFIELDLQKKACSDPFDVKQQSTGVFIEGFGNKATVDRGDEIIATDAWELDNFKRNPVILFNHGYDTLGGTPVGKATEVRATDEGLYLKVKLSNSQAPGIKMVRDLVEERILKAFSVGFSPKEADTIELDGKSIRRISKAELFEVSIVGIPMNQDSLFELSEKSLTTKSFHQVKAEILKAKGAEDALQIEHKLASCASRRDVMALVCKTQGLTLAQLYDMLAGETPVTNEVTQAFDAAIKAVDLKQTLEEALAAINEGTAEAEVLSDLLAKLKEEDSEEEESAQEDGETESSEEEDDKKEDEGSEEQEDEGDGEGEDQGDSESQRADEEARRKADFQDCVNSLVPKLLEEGMEQDQAVAAAIAKCQEQGKCQLTPKSKIDLFRVAFETLGKGEEKFDLQAHLEFRAADTASTTETPTTPILTTDAEDDFGSPQLEAAKQTNVLLGALINEIQKLSSKLDGISSQNSVSSSDASQESSNSNSQEAEDHAAKRIEELHLRLKSLGF